jgi:hypothetical protein
MTHIKKQTDIGDFPVKRLETTKPNITLADIKTFGGLVIHRHAKHESRFRKRKDRVNKIIKEIGYEKS